MVKEPNESVDDRVESSECNYPVLSHRPSQRPSMRLQTIYIPPFVHPLYSHISSFALSRCFSAQALIEIVGVER